MIITRYSDNNIERCNVTFRTNDPRLHTHEAIKQYVKHEQYSSATCLPRDSSAVNFDIVEIVCDK